MNLFQWILLPRNEVNWFENLPDEIESSIELKLYYGHLFCHVMHQNYIVKNGVNPKEILNKLLDFYNQRGAEYPAEHNVGHEYKAKKSLVDFYKKLDQQTHSILELEIQVNLNTELITYI